MLQVAVVELRVEGTGIMERHPLRRTVAFLGELVHREASEINWGGSGYTDRSWCTSSMRSG